MTAEPHRGHAKGRGYAKGRAKRREIIDHAMALFGEVGYRGASLREIASRCGISHPGLLHHFPTKESLLFAVLEHRDEVDGEWLALGGAKGWTGCAGFADLAELNATRRGIVELFSVVAAEATSPNTPRTPTSWSVTATRSRPRHRRTPRRPTRAPCAPAIAPDAAAQQLIALMDGLQVQWLLSGCATDMAGVLRAHLRTQLTVAL